MKLYLVRHGQTDSNREVLHQFPETPLSKLGERQAKFVGKRFESIKIEKLISSTYKRAHQTALEIQATTGRKVILSELFIERQNPSIYRGKQYSDPEILPIKKLIKENANNPKYHHSNEENFYDLEKRANAAIKFILDQKVENLAVVTHGFFLRFLLSKMVFQDILSYEISQSFYEHSKHSNTGITVVNYEDNKWELITLNDHAHLGE